MLHQASSDALITAGNCCERKFVKKGEIIVAVRYYGLEYAFLGELRSMGVSFVLRIGNKPRMEVVEEMALTGTDWKAGVSWHGCVKLGDKRQVVSIRVVKVQVEGKELLLATDLEMEAELIALMYRYRWQVELFFKWLKSILGCQHLMAKSPKGVAIQIYSALIAALMLQVITGKRPGKRAREMLRFYQMGYMDLDELMEQLSIEKQAK